MHYSSLFIAHFQFDTERLTIQLLQSLCLAKSVDKPYVKVFSSIDEGLINQYGVVVNTNGNVDVEAELHVSLQLRYIVSFMGW